MIRIFFNTGTLMQTLAELLQHAASVADAGGVRAQLVHAVLNVLISLTALVAFVLLLSHRERKGMIWALVEVILSLTVLQMVTFYVTQFSAIGPTLVQFVMLVLILTYQAWYLDREAEDPAAHAEI